MKHNTTNIVTFDLTVLGSTEVPVVKVIFNTTPEISFIAKKIDELSWKAEISIPDFITPSSYEMRIEVNVDNRIFTPLRKVVQIEALENQVVPVAIPPVEELQREKTSVSSESHESNVKPVINDLPKQEKTEEKTSISSQIIALANSIEEQKTKTVTPKKTKVADQLNKVEFKQNVPKKLIKGKIVYI